jgi:glycosyltransferase involved in cell wall biosynthesis
MRSENFMLSVILLSYQSENNILREFEKVDNLLRDAKIPFEFVIIDDGSTDDSVGVAQELARSVAHVRSFALSRNYTSHYAAFAGLSISDGGCAAIIPDDGQQPHQLLVDMYRLWEKGSKVVFPFRSDRQDRWLDRTMSKLFYQIINIGSDVKIPANGADTWLIDRELIDILNSCISPIRTTTISEILRLGFSPQYIGYTRPKSSGASRWTLRKKVRLASDWFYSSSSFLITSISFLGVLVFLSSFALAFVYAYARAFGNDSFWGLASSPGWVSLVCILLFSLGIVMLSLGIMSQYIWRIYEEVKSRPGFVIKKD